MRYVLEQNMAPVLTFIIELNLVHLVDLALLMTLKSDVTLRGS